MFMLMVDGDSAQVLQRLPETIERYGVLLRRWTEADVDTLHAMITRNVEHLRPFMPWVSHEPLTVEQRRDLIERWSHQWSAGGDVTMGIWRAGIAVGSTGLRRLGLEEVEIGYWVDEEHLRQGIATAASRALTDLAFTVPGIERVRICHDTANEASARVPIILGFVRLLDRPSASGAAPAGTGVDAVWQVSRQVWPASS